MDRAPASVDPDDLAGRKYGSFNQYLRGRIMQRRVREYVEIDSHRSLDDIIEELRRVRDSLPDSAEAELRMRGDDFFGRHLCVTYLRQLTAEEARFEARYSLAGFEEVAAAA